MAAEMVVAPVVMQCAGTIQENADESAVEDGSELAEVPSSSLLLRLLRSRAVDMDVRG